MRRLEFRNLSKEQAQVLGSRLMAQGMSVDRIPVMLGVKVVAYGEISTEGLNKIMDDLGVQVVGGEDDGKDVSPDL